MDATREGSHLSRKTTDSALRALSGVGAVVLLLSVSLLGPVTPSAFAAGPTVGQPCPSTKDKPASRGATCQANVVVDPGTATDAALALPPGDGPCGDVGGKDPNM